MNRQIDFYTKSNDFTPFKTNPLDGFDIALHIHETS